MSTLSWNINLATIAVTSREVEVPYALEMVELWVGELLADDALRVIDPSLLSSGSLTNDDLTCCAESYPGWCYILAQVVGDDFHAI